MSGDEAAGDGLSRRLAGAMEARNANDIPAIAIASGKVIALGLADMAKLRMDDRAFEDAAKLCRESLEFEDTPETRIELAIVSLYAKHSADALEQASLVTQMEPQNDLAWKIKGEALLQSEDYAGAAVALSKSLELKQDAESLYGLGIAHLGIGEKQSAAADFAKFLNLVGEHGWSRLLMGKAYQEVEMPAEAEGEFAHALRLDPLTANAHYYWAVTLLRKNAWVPTPEVKYQLQEELKLNPRHFLANYLLGFFASNERDYEVSDHYLQLAAKLDPSFPEVWLFLGQNAYNRGAKSLSETYLRKAVSLTKDEPSAKHLSMRKAYFMLGRILFSSGRKTESEQFFHKANELEQEYEAKGRKRLAAHMGESGEAKNGTVVPELPASDRQNSLAAASGASGHAPANREEPRAASRHSPQSVAGKQEEELRVILGSSFNDLATAEALQEKYALAAKHYREATEWDSRIPGLQRNLGLAAFYVGENGEAIHLLANVVRTAPTDEHARAVLGLAYFATEDFTKAAQTLSPMSARATQDPQLGFALAESLFNTGNKAGAAQVLTKLEESNSSVSVQDLVQFAQLWLELRETKRAEQDIDRALLNNPTDAIRYLEEAARLKPTNRAVHLVLETAYRKAGRTADADSEHAISETLRNRQQKSEYVRPKSDPK
ncbi:MAG TPA: tetratricopeptide repeat protein [Candidatus Dormibacteraeota bacterium]|nr:tetratricopeptide repeat protein [Candidatus Dormibacteraeota bacterium]